MSSGRGMFRIYKCRKCKNTGYSSVSSEENESRCSLCGTMVLHERGTIYAATVSEAKELMYDLVLSTSKDHQLKMKRGLGVKRRVLHIVEAVVTVNRGKPAKTKQVLQECVDADIPLDRASHFLDILKNEGMLVDTDEGIMVIGDVI